MRVGDACAYLPVLVLAGSESMGDSLKSIHKRTGTVIRWVHLQAK